MATVITTHCDACHADLKLKPEAVHLFQYSIGFPGDYYAFFCTKCRTYCAKVADAHVCSLLLQGGVPHTLIEVPLEVVERKACRTPLRYDDLLDLMQYLRNNNFMPEQKIKH